MPVIPRGIYRQAEWHLHNVRRCLAAMARHGAVSPAQREMIESSQLPGGIVEITGIRGGHSDRTGKAGMALAAGWEKQGLYERWLGCIERTERHFAGMPESDMARRYYGQHVTVLAVAEAMYVDRQTVNRYRDRYVTFLALAAACEGLIDLTEARCG